MSDQDEGGFFGAWMSASVIAAIVFLISHLVRTAWSDWVALFR
jgi:hypothetical protein